MIKIAWIIICLLVSGCWSDKQALDSHSVIHLSNVETLANDDFSSPPAAAHDWQQVSLPDNWNLTRPDQGGGVWYRISIDLTEDARQSMAVLVANFSMNASIWWGDIQIESGGHMTKPYTRSWHRPLYATINPEQLKRGHHWLYVRVQGYANDASGLGDVYFGPESELLPIYGTIFFMQRTLSFMALACTLLLAFGALLMWLLQRKQSAFLWVACASLAWSLVICNFVVLDPPMSRFYWEALVDGAIEVYAMILLILVLRVLGEPKPLLERSVIFLMALGWAVILLFGDDVVLMAWAMPIHTLTIVIIIYLLCLCLYRWYQQQNLNAFVLALAILIQLATAAHDWWVVYFGNQLDSVLIMQTGPTLTLIVVGGWMIYSFSKSLRLAETHTTQMEAEVMRVTANLKQEQQQLAKLQKKQVIHEERERFTRELHDGLGGYLAAISSMLHDGVRDEKVLTQTIDQALLEMRVVMDGVGEECHDVGMLLGMLRHRLQQPLQAWGLQVSWNLTGVPMRCTLQDGHAIHVMRIVQEALTNAARHANADWVEVRASMMQQSDQDHVCIEVIDNGCGWDALPEAGKGLSNMQSRSDIMGATLTMSSVANSGVHIRLVIPVYLA
ncbi:hypothetical protein JYT48_00355 [Mariprofundus ferrooxydans]|nr:hypothetical protein [Mariprofundus ferrooxydans]